MYRILVVSDDPLLRSMICLSLASVQAQVRAVSPSAQLEELCRSVLYDIIIVLRSSYFANGNDIVSQLRSESLRRPLIYVISWQHNEQTTLSLLESGVDQYMTFPLSLQRLKAKIAGELESKI